MADYSINAVTRRIVFSGSAGTGPYAFTFEVLNQTDIAVYFNAVKLTLTTDYTVTVAANGTGSVTIVVGTNVPSTPVTADQITIVGARAISRTTDFVTAGDLRASALNEQLDGQIVMAQQISEENKRAVRAPVYDPALAEDGGVVDMELPTKASRAGNYLAFDTDGNPTVGVEVGVWRGNWAATVAFALRDIVKDTTNNNIYIATTAHTSSGSLPISSNADAAKWALVVDAAAAATSAAASATSATASANSATASASSASTSSAQATIATNYAIKVDGVAAGSDHSAKAWAVGGTGITDTSGKGAAKEWATEAEDNTVAGAGTFSALHYSAKAATSAGTASTQATNSSDSATASATSATASATSATAAASSATAAANSAASIGTSPTFVTVTASTSVIPDASGGADLGSTSREWGDLYIADDKKLLLGSDQNFSLEYDEDGNDTTVAVAANGLSLGPHGTSTGNTTELRFQELAAGGAHYTGFKAADALAGNVIYTLPTADGSDGHVLKTDGSGALTWVAQTGGVSLSNDTNNYVATATGSGLNGEANLIFDGNNLTMKGPTLTVGDATAEDTMLLFDGNAQDYRIGLDDGTDTLEIGLGNAHGTTAHIITDVNGIVRKPLQPAFSAYRSSAGATVTTGSTTKIAFNAESFDVNADNATDTFTAPVDGSYLFTAVVDVYGIGTNNSGRLSLYLYKNDALFAELCRVVSISGAGLPFIETTLAGSVFMDLDASDEVCLYLYNNTGATVTLNYGSNLYMHWGGTLLG